jgi:sugar lactone lactonase YvrE
MVTAASALVFAAIPALASYSYSSQWGSLGSGNGQFGSNLRALAVDSSDHVYAADASNNRIQEFDSSGGFIRKWGSGGSTNGKFSSPVGVTVSSSGNVFVADYGNDRVQEFGSTGSYIRKWGSTGTGDGQFSGPISVAESDSGDVYVADSGNDRIEKFSSAGSFVRKWGSVGTGDGQFSGPDAVAVAGSGNVYVADNGNCRIQEFSSTGSFIRKWGACGSGAGQFMNVVNVAIDGAGDILASDYATGKIEKFTPSGVFMSQFGSAGSGDGQFGGPDGVAVDGAGDVFVADGPNSRIEKFQPAPPATAISLGPANGSFINDPTPTFSFSSSEAGSSFTCRHDSGTWASCTSPRTLATLGDGAHTWEVRAKDLDGFTDPTSASRSFTVDTQPPDTTITAGPANGSLTNDPTPTFSFSSPESGSDFQCALDSAGFQPCSAPDTTTHLGDGQHSFSVQAKDRAGNVDATATTAIFNVDTIPPALTISSATVKLSGQGVAAVKLTCPLAEASGPCTGKLSLKTAKKVNVGGHRKKVKLGSASFSIPSGSTEAADIDVAKANQRLVKKLGHVSVKATAHAKDAAGNKATASQKLTLKAP